MKAKIETYENFIESFKKRLTWNVIQNSLYTHTKKTLSVKRCIVLLDWLDKCLINSSRVENHNNSITILISITNSITILGYSNDKNIYIAKNVFSIDYLILFTRFGTFNQQRLIHSIKLCLQKSLRKLIS